MIPCWSTPSRCLAQRKWPTDICWLTEWTQWAGRWETASYFLVLDSFPLSPVCQMLKETKTKGQIWKSSSVHQSFITCQTEWFRWVLSGFRVGRVARKAFWRRADSTWPRRPIGFGWVTMRKVDISGNGSNTKAWSWFKVSVSGGTMTRPVDWSGKFLLLSGERFSGKSRLDYGEPWIINKERFFLMFSGEGIIESIQDLPCCCNYCWLQLKWDPRGWGRMSVVGTIAPKETNSVIQEEHYQQADGSERRETGGSEARGY